MPFLFNLRLYRQHWIAGVVLYCLYFQGVVQAGLEAAVILPHGDFAWDPTLLPDGTAEREAADAIAQGAAAVAEWMGQKFDPDLILLSTPHGIALTRDFALYLGSTASGTATIGKDLHNASHASYTIGLSTIALEAQASSALVVQAFEAQHNVSGILVAADDSEDMPLHWAEVIPLLLIPPSAIEVIVESVQNERKLPLQETTASTGPFPGERQRHHMILSHPLRRFTDAAEMVPELLRLGHFLRHWMDQESHVRIGVVISGDLSHTHLADGPYGYSNASAIFDAAVGHWASNPCQHAHALLQTSRDLQDEAMSCGFTGFVLLHGILCGNDSGQPWISNVAVNQNATYYGMMAATFERNE